MCFPLMYRSVIWPTHNTTPTRTTDPKSVSVCHTILVVLDVPSDGALPRSRAELLIEGQLPVTAHYSAAFVWFDPIQSVARASSRANIL